MSKSRITEESKASEYLQDVEKMVTDAHVYEVFIKVVEEDLRKIEKCIASMKEMYDLRLREGQFMGMELLDKYLQLGISLNGIKEPALWEELRKKTKLSKRKAKQIKALLRNTKLTWDYAQDAIINDKIPSCTAAVRYIEDQCKTPHVSSDQMLEEDYLDYEDELMYS